MKILHLLSQRPEITGSGITIQALLREAERNGHEGFLVAGIPAGPEPETPAIRSDRRFFVRFEGEDLPHAVVGMSDVMPYPSRRFRDLSAPEIERYEEAFARRVAEAVDSFAPDLIHSHHLWILTSLTRRRVTDRPVVATCHGSDLRQLSACPHLADRVVAGCRKLDAIFCLSEAQRREVVERYGIPASKVHVVWAGFNDQLFRPGEQPAPPPVEIVYAGKLSRAKGVTNLLPALATIDQAPWHLHLVGEASGPEREEVRALAASLAGRVTSHGALPQAALAGLLSRAHLFVLPSLFEGLPLVLLEALAAGCQLVASALPGPHEALSGLEDPYVRWVKLPRLCGADTPHPDDVAQFESRIAAALKAQIASVLRREEIDWQRVEAHLRRFTWVEVFCRVQRVYRELRASTC